MYVSGQGYKMVGESVMGRIQELGHIYEELDPIWEQG